MRQRIAELAGLPPERVAVKATTSEKLGFTGRGEGIAAQATATLLFERVELEPAFLDDAGDIGAGRKSGQPREAGDRPPPC